MILARDRWGGRSPIWRIFLLQVAPWVVIMTPGVPPLTAELSVWRPPIFGDVVDSPYITTDLHVCVIVLCNFICKCILCISIEWTIADSDSDSCHVYCLAKTGYVMLTQWKVLSVRHINNCAVHNTFFVQMSTRCGPVPLYCVTDLGKNRIR